MGAMLTMLLLLVACASEDDQGAGQPLRLVNANLTISLPKRIANIHRITRMSSDIVQANSDENDFRGLSDIHMLCFNQYPTQTSSNLGNMISIKTSGDEVNDTVTEEDYSLCQEISIPVGTSHFGFYARADDAPKTHAERMKYGVIETVGLGRSSYQGNSGIRFRPVQICTSRDSLGDSPAGHALLRLLDDLMNTTVDVPSPNNSWSSVGNIYMNEAWQQMTQLTTLSSFHIQTMLEYVYRMMNMESPDEQGKELAEAISAKIASCCVEVPDSAGKQLILKDNYLGFPADINLPDGAARICWNAQEKHFVVPATYTYGNGLHATSVTDYVYPMNLQYQVFSDLLASEEQVINKIEPASSDTLTADTTQYKNWTDLINNGYAGADKTVQPTTQSVAMVQQVQYAVGRIAVKTRIGTGTIYDAKGNYVPSFDGMFTLKGYVVGGQHEVDYDFQPMTTSRAYAIYDTDVNGGPQPLKRRYFTEQDHILALGTAPNTAILIALELVNNGDDFQGADGVIVKGATFYLVASVKPQDGVNYSETLNQIVSKDRYTSVNITINSLAEATYGLPNMQIPRPMVGLSVDLKWEEGLWYDDVPLEPVIL